MGDEIAIDGNADAVAMYRMLVAQLEARGLPVTLAGIQTVFKVADAADENGQAWRKAREEVEEATHATIRQIVAAPYGREVLRAYLNSAAPKFPPELNGSLATKSYQDCPWCGLPELLWSNGAEAQAVLRAFAESDPVEHDRGFALVPCRCLCCGAETVARCADDAPPGKRHATEHAPACPWLRARKLCGVAVQEMGLAVLALIEALPAIRAALRRPRRRRAR